MHIWRRHKGLRRVLRQGIKVGRPVLTDVDDDLQRSTTKTLYSNETIAMYGMRLAGADIVSAFKPAVNTIGLGREHFVEGAVLLDGKRDNPARA